MTNHEQKIWDFIVGNGIATEEELGIANSIANYGRDKLPNDEDWMNVVIYQRTGFHDVEQLYQCRHCNELEGLNFNDYFSREQLDEWRID